MDKNILHVYMTPNQIIKSLYHAFAFIILFYIAFNVKLPNYQKYTLLFIGIFHAYDMYWFFNNTSDAPI